MLVEQLNEAGIDQADLLMAVTGSDERNLLCSGQTGAFPDRSAALAFDVEKIIRNL